MAASFFITPVAMGKESVQPAIQAAKHAALQALELDDMAGEVHALLGSIRLIETADFREAEREYQRALELAPQSALVHAQHGIYGLGRAGRLEEATEEIKRAIELDPLTPLYERKGR